MQPEDRDPAYLWDMLEVARLIGQFIEDMTIEQFLQDRKTQAAVERSVEIIGEAAKLVSTSFTQAHPEISWPQIVGMRNVLAHEYGAIIQSRMWTLATEHIPILIGKLEPLIPPLPSEESSEEQ
jgi:uncharacterized protein with HEPN domain